MTLRFSYYIVLFSLLLLQGCSKDKKVAPTARPDDTIVRMEPFKPWAKGITPQYIASKSAVIDRFFNKTWSSDNDNISFIVVKQGKIIYERYKGIADRQKKLPISATTPLHIASVSKVLTATAVLELIDAGKIELDQKVNTILTTFPYPEVTIRTLLNHRSGLQNYAYFADQKHIWDKKDVLSNQDVLDLFIKHNAALNFPTDKKFAYCNTNYVMLALIIEKITGLSYPRAMKQMIFDPLGMNNTYVFEYDKHKETAIPSYKGNNVEIGLDFLDATYGDKNIYSTPRDLMKFDMARYSPDHLNPKLMKQVYVGYSYEHKGEKNYGLGIRIIEWVTGQHFYFHNGWWHGNTASYVNLRDEQVMIIALTNKFSTKPYKVRFLATIFGDYPFKMDDELE
ncbi:MAG TPA: serine hydrolase domain-containing protein [Flavobacterium sp.]|jgi:CubicO group peptidase (beta-lactamase class C family)|nr:serine hydrolase domain-containing protein [Flavobacterium sp.]